MLFAVVCTLAATFPADSRDEAPDLFTSVQSQPPTSPPDGRYLRAYTVGLDMEALRQPARTLTLNLPGDDPEIVELRHWEPRQGYIQIPDPDDPTGMGSITIPDPNARPEDFWWHWYGKSDRYTVSLTVVQGIVAGRISSATHRYAIEPNSQGLTRLGLVNSAYWQTHPGDGKTRSKSFSRMVPATASPPTMVPSSCPVPPPTGGSWDPGCSGPLPDDQYVIDVLLLYTSGILARHGNNHAAVHAVLQLTLDHANRALRNSGIQNVTFSPRGPEFLPNPPPPAEAYDDMFIWEAIHTLAGIQEVTGQPVYCFPGNAYVAGRRNALWADVVALARADPGPTCGASYPNRVTVNNGYLTEPGPDFEKLAYLIYDPACDADRLNLTHELGHQLGMEHDPTNFDAWDLPGNDPSCPWSFGHKRSFGDPRFRFRTVMSYWQNQHGGPNGPPDCGHPDNCPLIDAYSTPLLEWAGEPGSGGPPPFELQPVGTVPGASPIGVAVQTSSQKRANAVDTIRRIAPIVQGYRARPDVIFTHGFQ